MCFCTQVQRFQRWLCACGSTMKHGCSILWWTKTGHLMTRNWGSYHPLQGHFPSHTTWPKATPVIPSLTVPTMPQVLVTKPLKHVPWRTVNVQIKANNYTVARVCNSSTQKLEAGGLHYVQRQSWLQSKPSPKTKPSKTLNPGALPIPDFPVPLASLLSPGRMRNRVLSLCASTL